jgi:hypothetical protein
VVMNEPKQKWKISWEAFFVITASIVTILSFFINDWSKFISKIIGVQLYVIHIIAFILSVILLIYLSYLFFKMAKKRHLKKNNDRALIKELTESGKADANNRRILLEEMQTLKNTNSVQEGIIGKLNLEIQAKDDNHKQWLDAVARDEQEKKDNVANKHKEREPIIAQNRKSYGPVYDAIQNSLHRILLPLFDDVAAPINPSNEGKYSPTYKSLLLNYKLLIAVIDDSDVDFAVIEHLKLILTLYIQWLTILTNAHNSIRGYSNKKAYLILKENYEALNTAINQKTVPLEVKVQFDEAELNRIFESSFSGKDENGFNH